MRSTLLSISLALISTQAAAHGDHSGGLAQLAEHIFGEAFHAWPIWLAVGIGLFFIGRPALKRLRKSSGKKPN